MDVELHRQGINIVCNDLTAQGFELIDYNDDPKTTPQILARKNGQLCMFLVRTERLPDIGSMDTELAPGFVNYALEKKALSYFIGVGLEPLGEQTHVKILDMQFLSIDMPLPSDAQYIEQYPTRVRVDRAPKFPDLYDFKVVWRTDGRAIVEGGDWRLSQWEGLFKGYNREKNLVMIRFTDERIPAEIREFWYKSGFNDPLFEVPASDVWLADNEIYRLAPQITPAEIRGLTPVAPAADNSSASEEKKPWWKVW